MYPLSLQKSLPRRRCISRLFAAAPLFHSPSAGRQLLPVPQALRLNFRLHRNTYATSTSPRATKADTVIGGKPQTHSAIALEQYAAKPPRPVSLRQLIFFGGRNLDEGRLLSSANYVRTELPTRIARELLIFTIFHLGALEVG